MVLHGLAERAEDNAHVVQFFFERRGDGNAVKNGVYGNARQPLLLSQRNAQFLKRFQQFRVYFVQTVQYFFGLGRGVVDDFLIIYRARF